MKKYLFLITCYSLFTSDVFAQNDKDAIFYECYGRTLAVDPSRNTDDIRNFCQCQNDMALERMNPSDWEKYSKDYLSFLKLDNNLSKYEQNSYEQSLAFINNDCIICKEKKYKGCLRNTDGEISPEKIKGIASNIRYGYFNMIEKDVDYANFFISLISVYSDHCGHTITSGVRFFTTDKYGNELKDKPQTIVEDKYVEAYKKYLEQSVLHFGTSVTDEIFHSLSEGKLPSFGIEQTKAKMVSEEVLRNYLGNKCGENTALGRIYDNLDLFETNQTPIVSQERMPPVDFTPALDIERIKEIQEKYTRESMALRPDLPLSCRYDTEDLTHDSNIQSKINNEYLLELIGDYKTYKIDMNGVDLELGLWPSPDVREMHKGKIYISGYAYFISEQCMVNATLSTYNLPGYGRYISLELDGSDPCVKEKNLSRTPRIIESGVFILNTDETNPTWKMFKTNFLENDYDNCAKATYTLIPSKLSLQAVQAFKSEHREYKTEKSPAWKDDVFWNSLMK